jgi:hypothetical protein
MTLMWVYAVKVGLYTSIFIAFLKMFPLFLFSNNLVVSYCVTVPGTEFC